MLRLGLSLGSPSKSVPIGEGRAAFFATMTMTANAVQSHVVGASMSTTTTLGADAKQTHIGSAAMSATMTMTADGQTTSGSTASLYWFLPTWRQ